MTTTKYILLIAVILLLIIFIYNRQSENFSGLIDIVYTWVDPQDYDRDEYKNLYGFSNNDGNLDSARYTSTDELLYSIRSIFKYCGDWLGKIYIVVKDGQCPKFLDFSNPKLVLVNHSEIMPKSVLPTFNSLAIELCIHKIKNLSKTYVYFNDDMFLGAEFHPTKNGKICVNKIENNIPLKFEKVTDDKPYSFTKLTENTNYYGKKLLKADIDIKFVHTPSICYKPWEEEMEQLLRIEGLWQETINSKFRKNTNIITTNSFRTFFYLKKKNIEIVNWEDATYNLRSNDCKINYTSIFNINSIDYDCRKQFIDQMEKLYPHPSPVEKMFSS